MFSKVKERIHEDPKRIAPVILVLILLGVGGYYLVQMLLSDGNSTYSGTVEATLIHLGAENGGRVDAVYVSEGERVESNQLLVEIHRISGGSEKVRSPINGTVLHRLVEPGEVAGMGSSLLTLADLETLTLTVYAPEDRYGQIMLGQVCQVTVDSFPGQSFNGTVSHIAEQAEFTPRNVQTVDSRKTTVFAIRLDLEPAGGKLKPGMPADVHFKFEK